MIKKVKAKRDVGVIIYTGFAFDEISQGELAGLSDLIIDGAYIDDLNDDLSLRGSSNQNVCLITERYREEAKTLYGTAGRKVELRLDNSKAMLIGVPDKKSLRLFGEGRGNE